VPGGTLVRIAPSGIALAGAAAAMVANIADNKSITLKNLIITPPTGTVGGPVAARAIQVYGRNATPVLGTTYDLNVENVILTAVKVVDGTPVLNPLEHAASANTIAARNAELAAFDGGGANNAIEIRFVGAAESNSLMVVNMKNTVITHIPHGAAAARYGGIAVSRTRGITLNVLEGCVISYNSGSAIRGVGTLQGGTSFINITGTATNPVFIMKNGWMEDTANTARNEGLQNDGSNVLIEHAYFIGQFQEHIDKLGLGSVTIRDSYFAEAQTDLDPTNGTAPNVANAANLKLSGTGNVTITRTNIYDNKGASTNQQAIAWTAPAATSTMLLDRAVIAGPGDALGPIGGANAATYTEDDTAIVQDGPDALASGPTFGAGTVASYSDRVTADPQFASTVFAPTWNGLGVLPGNLTNYLSIHSTAYRAGSARANEVASQDVKGANADSPLPVSVSGFSID
jgi:hypothetical protein